MFAVEPEGYDDMAESLAAGARRVVATHPPTFCDALLAATPGAIPFSLCKRLLAGACTVTDDEVARAMAMAAGNLKLVVEPSGAAALAAVLARKHDGPESIGLVLSGGNVDAALLMQALGKYTDI